VPPLFFSLIFLHADYPFLEEFVVEGEVTCSSRGNNLLQNLQGNAAYRDLKWSGPSPDPAQSESFMHQAAPLEEFVVLRLISS
jgi:hypothetical protein